MSGDCPTAFDLGERIHDERIRYPVLAGDWSKRATEYAYEMAQEIARVVVEAGWAPRAAAPEEIDRLRAANDQLAQLLADRDQREDTLNDDIAALQAENQAWQSYATWSCTRDGATYPCGDCDGCRAGVWNSQAANAVLRARIDAARALCEPSEWSVLDPRRERLLRALNGEGATDE